MRRSTPNVFPSFLPFSGHLNLLVASSQHLHREHESVGRRIPRGGRAQPADEQQNRASPTEPSDAPYSYTRRADNSVL